MYGGRKSKLLIFLNFSPPRFETGSLLIGSTAGYQTPRPLPGLPGTRVADVRMSVFNVGVKHPNCRLPGCSAGTLLTEHPSPSSLCLNDMLLSLRILGLHHPSSLENEVNSLFCSISNGHIFLAVLSACPPNMGTLIFLEQYLLLLLLLLYVNILRPNILSKLGILSVQLSILLFP